MVICLLSLERNAEKVNSGLHEDFVWSISRNGTQMVNIVSSIASWTGKFSYKRWQLQFISSNYSRFYLINEKNYKANKLMVIHEVEDFSSFIFCILQWYFFMYNEYIAKITFAYRLHLATCNGKINVKK